MSEIKYINDEDAEFGVRGVWSTRSFEDHHQESRLPDDS